MYVEGSKLYAQVGGGEYSGANGNASNAGCCCNDYTKSYHHYIDGNYDDKWKSYHHHNYKGNSDNCHDTGSRINTMLGVASLARRTDTNMVSVI